MDKKIKDENIETIHDNEVLEENTLSEIVGGGAEAVACTCDCWIGNTNSNDSDKKEKEKNDEATEAQA
ncbi:MAG: hypothetical protein LUF85_16630 [Bacteroides sp.]|nr:hypothetical protein [Bacteroides sp.]